MRWPASALPQTVRFLLVAAVCGTALGKLKLKQDARTAVVDAPEAFHASFSPEVISAVDTVLVDKDLRFDDINFLPTLTLKTSSVVVRGRGVSGRGPQRQIIVPDKGPVAAIRLEGDANLRFKDLDFVVEKSRFDLHQGLVGLWQVEFEFGPTVLYEACTFVLDRKSFSALNNTKGFTWDTSANVLRAQDVTKGAFTYRDAQFLVHEVWIEADKRVLTVSDPQDITWLEEIQKDEPSRLEIHLARDILLDPCMLANASGGNVGAIPVRRPVVISAHDFTLKFTQGILERGFLKINRHPLVITRAVLDFRDVVVRKSLGPETCGRWECPLPLTAFPIVVEGPVCMVNMKSTTLVTPQQQGVRSNLDSQSVLFESLMSFGTCLVDVEFSEESDSNSQFQPFHCANPTIILSSLGERESPEKDGLGSIEITIVVLLAAGIIAVGLCLVIALKLGGNKWKTGDQYTRKLNRSSPTSSVSDPEGLPDSIVVSPDSEMGTYAPGVNLDLKLAADRSPMWIFEEIFNESNYERDSSFVLGEQIAAGGFGVVYKGTWKGIPVAIKTVVFPDKGRKELQQNKERARAIVEAAISSSVAHPNIVQTYAFSFKRVSKRGELVDTKSETSDSKTTSQSGSSKKKRHPRQTNWKLYMVQELCNAGSLNAALHKKAFMDTSNSPCLLYILQLALETGRGMLHLHRHNIIHGDLTTRNILLQREDVSKDGVRLTAKIADFGLSQKMEKSQSHVANHWAGTPFYMAPEVVQNGHLSKPADIFSFGIVLWEMYHSMECFQEQEDTSLDSSEGFGYHPLFPKFPVSCPMPLVMLCVSCLAPAPEDRPDFPFICKALSALLERVRRGDYSSTAAIQEANKETSTLIGKIESGQMVNIVVNLLKIDDLKSVQSRSMEVVQQPTTAVSLQQMPFYWPNEHVMSQSASETGEYHSIPHAKQQQKQPKQEQEQQQPAAAGGQKFDLGAFSYDKVEAENAQMSIDIAEEGKKAPVSPSPIQGSSIVSGDHIRVDDLEDGLEPWSIDVDDMDDAKKGLTSPHLLKGSPPNDESVFGITFSQKGGRASKRSAKQAPNEQYWEMDNGVLTGLEPGFRIAGNDSSSLPLLGSLPTLTEEGEGKENERTPVRGVPGHGLSHNAEDIFLSISLDVGSNT